MDRTTRILTLDDLSLYQRFYDESGMAEHESWNTTMDHVPFLLEGSQGWIWGTFQEDRLIATMAAQLWLNAPYYILKYLMTNIRKTGFNMQLNGLGACFDAMLDHMESMKYFRYFSRCTVGLHNAYMKYWPIQVPKTTRYEYVVEELVPPGKYPKNGLFYETCGRRTYSEASVIRSATLRNEFRPDLNRMSFYGEPT